MRQHALMQRRDAKKVIDGGFDGSLPAKRRQKTEETYEKTVLCIPTGTNGTPVPFHMMEAVVFWP